MSENLFSRISREFNFEAIFIDLDELYQHFSSISIYSMFRKQWINIRNLLNYVVNLIRPQIST